MNKGPRGPFVSQGRSFPSFLQRRQRVGQRTPAQSGDELRKTIFAQVNDAERPITPAVSGSTRVLSRWLDVKGMVRFSSDGICYIISLALAKRATDKPGQVRLQNNFSESITPRIPFFAFLLVKD